MLTIFFKKAYPNFVFYLFFLKVTNIFINDLDFFFLESDQNVEFVKKAAKSKSNKKSRKEKRNHLVQETYFLQQQQSLSNTTEENITNQFGDSSFLSEGSTFRPSIEGT